MFSFIVSEFGLGELVDILHFPVKVAPGSIDNLPIVISPLMVELFCSDSKSFTIIFPSTLPDKSAF